MEMRQQKVNYLLVYQEVKYDRDTEVIFAIDEDILIEEFAKFIF